MRFWLVFFLFLITGCQRWSGAGASKPNIIVIAIESLNYELVPCIQQEQVSSGGFGTLCRETLRFTHLYTPTPLSQGGMASFLTGQKPENHKILHNGKVSLSAKWDTLAEKAVRSGMRTAFFSGGPPLLAKSGLSQGFEIFDDEFLLSNEFYKPAHKNLAATSKWLNGLGRVPGLVVSYLPDLQFPFLKTFTQDGQERERSFDAQKQVIDEALGDFFRDLKAAELWEDSYIIVFGLNGISSSERPNVLWRENLFRESVHIPFFIKPPKSEGVVPGSVDALLSLADGYSLITQIIESSVSDRGKVERWAEQNEYRERSHIEVRSDWKNWWFGEPGDISFRTYDYLIFPYEKLKLYHTLIDKNESIPLSEDEVGKEALRWLDFRVSDSYDGSNQGNKDLYRVISYIHTDVFQNHQSVADIKFKYDKSGFFETQLYADQALSQGDWEGLEKLGSQYEAITFVANKNMGIKKNKKISGNCESLFHQNPSRWRLRQCRDPLLVALYEWEKSLSASSQLNQEKNFMRKYRFYMRHKKIAYLNLMTELNWDVDMTTTIGPSLAELYLHLPRSLKLRKKIRQYQIPLSVSASEL